MCVLCEEKFKVLARHKIKDLPCHFPCISFLPCCWLRLMWLILFLFLFFCKDHFVCAPSQWEMSLHWNVISHWLGTFKKWSLFDRKLPPIHSADFNSLAPWKFDWNFRNVFNLTLMPEVYHEIALKWMSLDLTNDKSTPTQVTAWCHHASNHYPSQCWPRALLPFDISRPQWVKHHIQWKTLDPYTQCQIWDPDFDVHLKLLTHRCTNHGWSFHLFIRQSPSMQFCRPHITAKSKMILAIESGD